MIDEAVANFLAEALHDIEHAGGQARLHDQIAEQRGGEGRPLRGFQNHGVARCQGRGAFPSGEHERRVPWGDDHRRPGRHPLHAVRRALGRPNALFIVRREVGVVAEVQRRPGDHPLLQAVEQHGHVHAFDDGDVVPLGVDEVGEFVQIGGPLGRGAGSPIRPGGLGGVDGGLRRGGIAAGDAAEGEVPLQGRAGLESFAGRDALVVDEVVGGDLHPLHI